MMRKKKSKKKFKFLRKKELMFFLLVGYGMTIGFQTILIAPDGSEGKFQLSNEEKSWLSE